MNKSVVLLAMLLAGCASTPSDLVVKDPDLFLQSSKTAHSLAQCIYLRWEDTRGVVVNMRDSVNGFRVLLYRESELGQMVDIEKTANGSQVKFYNRHIAIGGNPWRDAVAQCQ